MPAPHPIDLRSRRWDRGVLSGFGVEKIAALARIIGVLEDVVEHGNRGKALAVDQANAGAVARLHHVHAQVEVGGRIVDAQHVVVDLAGDLVEAATGEGRRAVVAPCL